MTDVRIIETEDGSHSLFVPALNETYHSFHGAIRESQHIYINMGLKHWLGKFPGKNAAILEVGFGTGLNVLLSLQFAFLHKSAFHFTTLEPFPLDLSLIEKLNYVGKLQQKCAMDIDLLHLNKVIHSCNWNETHQLLENFLFTKLGVKLENYQAAENQFDIIYFDAFAPNKQAELWEAPVLAKIHDLLKRGGILVTYCAKGQFKRDLRTVGFEVETLPAPPGKKEMVRGVKV